jgi:hypothetical protein
MNIMKRIGVPPSVGGGGSALLPQRRTGQGEIDIESKFFAVADEAP